MAAVPSPSSGEFSTRTSYDELRYPGKFYPQSSPERLATLATLMGVDPPPVNSCRVLELGCGEGGNLIPVAYALPRSKFLGIDLSASAVEHGTGVIERLGLANVELRVQDLMDFPADAGEFDYIIAHGLYSWVPEQAQRKILDVCALHLAQHGIAYISYSTLPGGHFRQYARDLMRFHTRHISNPAAKTREARSIIGIVLDAIPKPTMGREVLRNEMAVYQSSDSFLFHDLLAEVNEPVYFLDFIDQAMSRGLQFVAESEVRPPQISVLPEPLRKELDGMGDRLLREQYLDFIHCRHFRQTLLCRSGRQLRTDVGPDRMERLLVASPLRPAPESEMNTAAPVEFRAPSGMPVTCHEPLPKAVYLELGEAWPRPVAYADLRSRVAQRMGIGDCLNAGMEHKLMRVLISSFLNRVLEFHVHETDFKTEVSERPVASPVAAFYSEECGPVPSLTLSNVLLNDPIARALLPLLDGSRDFDALWKDLQERVKEPVITPEMLRHSLDLLASSAMLIG